MALFASHRRLSITKLGPDTFVFKLEAENGLPYELKQVLNAQEIGLLIKELELMIDE